MRNLFLVFFIFSLFFLSAEVIIDEDFEGTFPPEGWSAYGMNPGNWSQSTTVNAGGVSPELMFSWSPSFTGESIYASGPVNTVGASTLDLSYAHFLNDFSSSGYTIGIKTSSDGVNWNTAYEVAPTGDIGPIVENITITTADVGSATFQLGFFFNGYSFDLDYWYIDDVLLEGILITYDNDLAGMDITGNTVVNAGNTETYEITVKNVGYNTQNAYTVKLFKGSGEELSSLDITQSIVPDEIVAHNLVWNVPDDEPAGIVELHGLVILQGDENTLNDETGNLNVEIFPQGVLEITVGTGTLLNNRTPVRFQYVNSLTEMLYFPEEMANLTGSIIELTFYNNFANNILGEEISIWLGETNLPSLITGWIPSTQLTQVFNGAMSFPVGINEIHITLDTPYFYEGSNLVMMVHRPAGSSYPSTDNFIHSETPDILDRTRYNADDFEIYDPASPPDSSYTFESFPNTTFSFYQGAMGDVEGYVYDDIGTPIAGAQIEIEELNMISISDNEGFYQFGNVLTGTYDFTATKFGYSPQTTTEEVLEDQTIYIDFNLLPLGTVIITGHVVGSDTPEVGLEGAYVNFTGFENYEVFTDENGDFIIPGVYTNITYDISVSYEGYEAYYGEVEVAGTNIDLETIILIELAFPPGNVLAVQNIQQTQVNLSWNSPGQGGGEFRYDDGEVDFQIGFNSSPPNGLIGAVHRNIAIIQEVQWYLTSIYGTHDDVKIVILGLTNGEPDVTQVLHISQMLDNIDDQWNTYILEEQIEAFEGFFIGINTPGEYTSLALDDGEGEPWIFEMGTHYTNENWMSGNDWTDIGSMGTMFERNMLLRAYGVNLGNTDLISGVYKESITSTTDGTNEKNSAISVQKEPVTGISNVVQKEEPTSSLSGESREFESYNIYRFPEQNHNNPSSWNLVGEAVIDTLYTDISWGSLPVGEYQFAIRSVHTNGIESLPAYSSVLEKTIGASTQEEIVPALNELYANYPNPFNPETTISFSILDNNQPTELTIYNLKGQKVRTLVNDILTAGKHFVVWNGKDDNGKQSASGIYFYHLKNGDFSSKQKMILIK